MPLTSALMIPDFRIAVSTPSIVPEPFALSFCNGLRKYVSAGTNIGVTLGTPGNFVAWIDPIAQVIAACRMFNVVPAAFAVQLAAAVDSAFLSLYTFGQLSIIYPAGLLIAPFTTSFSKFNIVPEVLAVELATAIDSAARSIVITILEPKLLSPVPGPFF